MPSKMRLLYTALQIVTVGIVNQHSFYGLLVIAGGYRDPPHRVDRTGLSEQLWIVEQPSLEGITIVKNTTSQR